MKGTYKVWKITTKPEWNPNPIYHGGKIITDIFPVSNEDYHKAIIKIEEVESGLSRAQIANHKIPMAYTP